MVIYVNNKRTRYVTTIFTLDRIEQSMGITIWDKEDLSDFIENQEKHYGLKLISTTEEILIIVEYTNIIWNYRIYYGSYKKKYPSLLKDDQRWTKIEKRLIDDLKIIGLDELKEEVLADLKSGKYFEYKTNIEKQFKKYCI